jgi:transcriptional regulator of acetoin/glycerol metabolism
MLARAFAEAALPGAELHPSAIAHVERHGWPGNVRELKSAILHAVALAGEEPLEAAHFPEPLLTDAPSPPSRSRDEILREAAAEALRAAGGNVSAAARRLGVARDTLYRLLRR